MMEKDLHIMNRETQNLFNTLILCKTRYNNLKSMIASFKMFILALWYLHEIILAQEKFDNLKRTSASGGISADTFQGILFY